MNSDDDDSLVAEVSNSVTAPDSCIVGEAEWVFDARAIDMHARSDASWDPVTVIVAGAEDAPVDLWVPEITS